MALGGKRPGVGRPKGSLTVRTRKIAERAAAQGKMPLEVMLETMRHFQAVAADAEAEIADLTARELDGGALTQDQQFKKLLAQVKGAVRLRQLAHECARDAAAYMHPKLASVAHTGPDGGPIQALFKTVYETRD